MMGPDLETLRPPLIIALPARAKLGVRSNGQSPSKIWGRSRVQVAGEGVFALSPKNSQKSEIFRGKGPKRPPRRPAHPAVGHSRRSSVSAGRFDETFFHHHFHSIV